jgi:hypothetical protein
VATEERFDDGERAWGRGLGAIEEPMPARGNDV